MCILQLLQCLSHVHVYGQIMLVDIMGNAVAEPEPDWPACVCHNVSQLAWTHVPVPNKPTLTTPAACAFKQL